MFSRNFLLLTKPTHSASKVSQKVKTDRSYRSSATIPDSVIRGLMGYINSSRSQEEANKKMDEDKFQGLEKQPTGPSVPE
jgi:hypothetical protein